MYENGLGVEKDYSEALKWFRKAADQGYPLRSRIWVPCTLTASVWPETILKPSTGAERRLSRGIQPARSI
jgi:hypothetical protein